VKLNEEQFLNKLLSCISMMLEHNPTYETLKEYGPIEINAYSITFWIIYQGSDGQKILYIKIPKYIFYNKKIDILSPVTKFDRELAKNELKSLEILSKAWDISNGVSFVKVIAYIEEYNAILTEHVLGVFLFKEFRKSDLQKKYKTPHNDKTMIGLYKFGKSVKSFHENSSVSSILNTQDIINKFNNYFIFLKSTGVSSKYLNSFIDIFIHSTNAEYHTLTSDNLKGIDIRQIFISDNQSLYVIDPGKLSQGHNEIDLARFIVTCRIIYWGTLKGFFRYGPHPSYEEKFLHGYFGKDFSRSKSLHIFILKEYIKHWKLVHSGILRRKWPFFIKYIIKKLYVDPFFKFHITKELSKLR
jgi:hypothetical protein